MKKLFLLLCFLLSITLCADSVDFVSKPMNAGKASLSENAYTVVRLLDTANFSPDLKLPVQLIYNSSVKKSGLFGFAWSSPHPEALLKTKFSEIKEECHRLGMAFYCAENRLRYMGDDLCCCGIAGLDGFKTNKFNYNHLFNGDVQRPTENMKQRGTAALFSALFQNAGIAAVLRNRSFADCMLSSDCCRCAEKVFGRTK